MEITRTVSYERKRTALIIDFENNRFAMKKDGGNENWDWKWEITRMES